MREGVIRKIFGEMCFYQKRFSSNWCW